MERGSTAHPVGVAYAAAAACLWGTTGIAAKISFGLGMSPAGILTLRLALTLPVYAAYLLGASPRRPSKAAAAIGLLVLGPYHIAYNYSVMLVGASTASLLLYTHPVFVAVASRFALGETLGTGARIALLLSVSGAALVSLGEVELDPAGAVLALVSSALFSAYVVLSRLSLERGVRPGEMALGTSAWALPTLLAFQAFTGFEWVERLRPEVVAVALYLALAVTAVAYALYMRGLKLIGAARTTIVSTAEPLTATALASALFAEPLTLLKAVGGGLIVASVILVATSREGRAERPRFGSSRDPTSSRGRRTSPLSAQERP